MAEKKRNAITKDAFDMYKPFGTGRLKHQPSPHNAIGYCHYKLHKGYLSWKAVKSHDCLGKQCPYLEKYMDKPVWVQWRKAQARKKALKKKQKEAHYDRYRTERFAEHISDTL